MMTGSSGGAVEAASSERSTLRMAGAAGAVVGSQSAQFALQPDTPQAMSGQGAQFIYAAATVANILCDNLTEKQIKILGNFLSVVTTCVFTVLTVEHLNDPSIIEQLRELNEEAGL